MQPESAHGQKFAWYENGRLALRPSSWTLSTRLTSSRGTVLSSNRLWPPCSKLLFVPLLREDSPTSLRAASLPSLPKGSRRRRNRLLRHLPLRPRLPRRLRPMRSLRRSRRRRSTSPRCLAWTSRRERRMCGRSVPVRGHRRTPCRASSAGGGSWVVFRSP